MPITRFLKAIKVLKEYMETSKRDYIYTQDLRGLIMKNIGSTSRTLYETLDMLRSSGIIKEVKLHKWKITIKE